MQSNNDTKNIVYIPGTGEPVSNRPEYPGIDIFQGKSDDAMLQNADWIITQSIGCNYVFSRIPIGQQKFIITNPGYIKKKSFLTLAWRSILFLLFSRADDGLHTIVPLSYWISTLKTVYRLTKIDTLAMLKKIPKGNLTVICGMQDKFYCNRKEVEVLKRENIPYIMVDAGHLWNHNTLAVVQNIINS